MPPLQTCASPSPTPQYNSKNIRRGLLQQHHQQEGEGDGESSSPSPSSSGKRLGRNHLPPHRSASFHGRITNAAAAAASPELHQKQQMRRPKTQPDLIAAAAGRSKNIIMSPSPTACCNLLRIGNLSSANGEQTRKFPAKVLVNVNVQRSLGALQVMASTEWTVNQLVAATVKQYVKEGRRPLLPTTDPSAFGLHYSQFSLECLEAKEKLIGLGSRNFFLCPNTDTETETETKTETKTKTRTATVSPSPPSASILPPPAAASTPSSSSSSCSKEADRAPKIAFPWHRFMDFLL